MQNSRLYQEKPLAALEFPIGYAMTLETLLLSYPKYVTLAQLPPPNADEEEEGEDAEVDPAAAEADLIELVETLFEEEIGEITNDPASVPEELRKGDGEDDEEEEERRRERKERRQNGRGGVNIAWIVLPSRKPMHLPFFCFASTFSKPCHKFLFLKF